MMDGIIHHPAVSISRLGQIHVFGEGNTRTKAVFFTRYLLTPDFDMINVFFAENAWYFWNSLVSANYIDLKNGIHVTTKYLELFMRNLLLEEDHSLLNRTLQISGTVKSDEKVSIEAQKANMEVSIAAKTATRVCRMLGKFGIQTIFERSDVQTLPDGISGQMLRGKKRGSPSDGEAKLESKATCSGMITGNL